MQFSRSREGRGRGGRGSTGTTGEPTATTLPFTDEFDRADGPVGNNWSDYAFTQPAYYSPMTIVSEDVGPSDIAIGRGLIYRNTDSADVSVTARIDLSESSLVQAGPACSIVVGDDQVGFTLYHNIVFGAWFLVAIGEDYDSRVVWDTNPTPIDVAGSDNLANAEVRTYQGQVAGYVDGNLVAGPVTMPAEHQTATRHGFYFAADDTVVTHNCERVVMAANASPLDTYAAPAVGNIGTGAEATSGTSIDVPYPVVSAGQWLICVVANSNNRSWTAPSSPWQVVQNAGTGQIVGIFAKQADGTETGNLTVNASGALTNARGVMFVVDQLNEVSGQATAVQANLGSAVTSLEVAAHNQTGQNRTYLFISWSNTNQTHTHPNGWTEVATLGDGTPAGVLKISRRSIAGTPPMTSAGQSTGTQTVTYGASCNARAIHVELRPQPY